MAKIYDEESMGGLRELLEERILEWPGVVKRPMFGTPGYAVEGKVFASLMQDSLTVKLDPAQFTRFEKALGAKPFTYEMGDGQARVMTGWLRIPYVDEGDLDRIEPAARAAYQHIKAVLAGVSGAGKPANKAPKVGPKKPAAKAASAGKEATGAAKPAAKPARPARPRA